MSKGIGIEADPKIPASYEHDSAVRINIAVLDRILPEHEVRNFSVKLWDSGVTIPASPGKPSEFTLILNHPGALRRMLTPVPSDLRVGEAYLDNAFEVEGNIESFVALADEVGSHLSNPREFVSVEASLLQLPKMREASTQNRSSNKLEGGVHSKKRDKESIAIFYNLPPNFYRLFLDSDPDPKKQFMQYSCARYPNPQASLTEAQIAKLEHTLRKLDLKAGDRLLDIGCGWGGLVVYAAKYLGVDATGITLSKPQAKYGNRRIQQEGLSDRCRIREIDYRDISKYGSFNKLVSVGMIEHVGKKELPRYYQTAFDILEPGGLFLCHGIANSNNVNLGWGPVVNLAQRVSGPTSFIQEYIFPGGELVFADESQRIAREAGFELRDVENLREHYAITLRDWIAGLEAHRQEAIDIVCKGGGNGEKAYRAHRLYMAGSAHAFATNKLALLQTLMAKNTPDGTNSAPLIRAA